MDKDQANIKKLGQLGVPGEKKTELKLNT